MERKPQLLRDLSAHNHRTVPSSSGPTQTLGSGDRVKRLPKGELGRRNRRKKVFLGRILCSDCLVNAAV